MTEEISDSGTGLHLHKLCTSRLWLSNSDSCPVISKLWTPWTRLGKSQQRAWRWSMLLSLPWTAASSASLSQFRFQTRAQGRGQRPKAGAARPTGFLVPGRLASYLHIIPGTYLHVQGRGSSAPSPGKLWEEERWVPSQQASLLSALSKPGQTPTLPPGEGRGFYF